MKSGPEKFFLLLVGVSFLQMLYFWPLMPDTMASHFDGTGRANGFAPRPGFFALYAGLIALFSLLFRFLPRLLNRFPNELINLPNKEFWLAPERRESTFAVIEQQMVLFGSATLILIIVTMQLVFMANRSGAAGIPGTAMWVLLALYIGFSLVWTISFVRRFFKKPR